MKMQTPLLSNIPVDFYNHKNNGLTNKKVSDTILDSFNEQTQLNNQFKLTIKKKIDSIEYAYPNEGIKLKLIIDSFIEESKKLSGNYMKKLLDTYLAFNPIEPRNHRVANTQNVITKDNENWMKDWMEQENNYKKNPEAMALISNNIEDFLHYADNMESKYV
jgi:hypothetical protein